MVSNPDFLTVLNTSKLKRAVSNSDNLHGIYTTFGDGHGIMFGLGC